MIYITEAFIQRLGVMPNDALKIFLYLTFRAKLRQKVPLTTTQLADICNIGRASVRNSIRWLQQENFITLKGKSITVNEEFSEKLPSVSFTREKDNMEAVLQLVIDKMQAAKYHNDLGEKSGVDAIAGGEERPVILEIERTLGRGLDKDELYLLGKAMSSFGPQRLIRTFRQTATAKNPIRASYAKLMNGVAGKAAKQRESVIEAKYRELT